MQHKSTNVADLPPGYHLRPAQAEDLWSIRKHVLMAKLDPTQIRWSQFWVIEREGQIIACGQLRDFADAQELGSLVVAPQWRGQGLGQYLTQHLIQQATKPLYLECLGPRLAQFYQRFNFVPIEWSALPPSLKRKFGLSKALTRLFRIPLFLMQYQPENK
jgi:amino-acid N-acetyltransferase